MSIMKISNANYQVVFSKDEKFLYCLGSTIKKISFSDKLTKIFEISELKNPSEMALSEDERFIAVLNTEGYIAIFDALTGQLMASTKALNQEGYGICFASDNRIVASTWEGNIIIYNYILNEFDIINIPEMGCGKLMPTQNINVFLLFCNASDNNSVKIKEIDLNKNTVNDIFTASQITAEVKTLFCQNNNYYFCGSLKTLDDTIYKFDYREKQLFRLFNIPEKIQAKNVANCISVNKSETTLALGYGNLYLIDILQKEFYKEIEASYISCCAFFDSDKQLYIGTWDGGFSITV